ncbi:MAG: hypothetical protein ABIH37_02740 [archaeon]
MSNTKPPLFVSFSGLVRQMKYHPVSALDLESGLFYFGCKESHLYLPVHDITIVSSVFSDYREEGIEVLHRIVGAFERAKHMGRAVPLNGQKRNTFRELNGLLDVNRIPVHSVRYLETLDSNNSYSTEVVRSRYSHLVRVIG